MWKKVLLLVLVTLLVGSGSIQPALGKEYPERPIEILCVFTPGSPSDILIRLVADTAAKYLGQPMVVVNKPGAAGSIAAADIVGSAPDGYKLIIIGTAFFSTTTKIQKIPFDPNDLTPIANLVEYKCGMIVKGNSPWKTFGDLLDYAKENPGKLRWSHPGRGLGLHINPLLIFRRAGITAKEVPYKGAPEMVSALLGGHVDAVSLAYGAVKEHVKAGNLKFLIFYSDRRYADSPNVPCAVELGFPDAAKIGTFIGIYAHKNTPQEAKKILYNAFKRMYDDPIFKKGIENFGEEPRFEGPEFIREAIKKSEEASVPILKELGLYVGR
jgi:tripartite-type tricarboxylate transporter receptor subunit TctC